MLKRFFSPPIFSDDPEKTGDARLLHQIILTSLAIPLLAITIYFIKPTMSVVLPLNIVFATILVTLLFVNRSGRVRLAGIVIVTVLVAIPTFFNFLNAGEVRPFLLITVIAILMSGLLLGSRAAMAVAFFFLVQHAAIAALNLNGFIVAQSETTLTQSVIVIVVCYLLIGIIYQLAISRSQTALADARKSEAELQLSNSKLLDLSASLEGRVAERTEELEKQQRQAERRSRQFEGIARVSKAIAATRNLHDALPQIVRVISEQFGFYHVGIFLTNSVNQFAVLSAANSEGGQQMLARNHQLKIGEQGMVGYVTQTGKPRIALDVGADAVFFNNAELPLTHSELALPLKNEDQVIGALDIQSTDMNAFSNEDIEALETLADQVGLAIQNARLFDQTEKTLADADAIQRQYIRETWSRVPSEEKLTGFRYSVAGAVPLNADTHIDDADERLNDKREINVPIILRGETIGTLSVRVPISAGASSGQDELIRAVAERVALSAENARLFEDTTRRAERERIISDITSKIGTSVRTENILKTAARELNQLLNGAEVLIKLGTNGSDQKN